MEWTFKKVWDRKRKLELKRALEKERDSVLVHVPIGSEGSVKALPIEQIDPSVLEENAEMGDHADLTFEKAIFSWVAPEYVKHEKGKEWWVKAGIVYGICLILAIWFAQWSLIFALLALGPVYYFVHEKRPPKHTKIVISDFGVKIGHVAIPFDQIKAYWIFYVPGVKKTLNFQTHRGIFNELNIELMDQDPVLIKEHLNKFIPEIEGKSEPMTEYLIRLLKL